MVTFHFPLALCCDRNPFDESGDGGEEEEPPLRLKSRVHGRSWWPPRRSRWLGHLTAMQIRHDSERADIKSLDHQPLTSPGGEGLRAARKFMTLERAGAINRNYDSVLPGLGKSKYRQSGFHQFPFFFRFPVFFRLRVDKT